MKAMQEKGEANTKATQKVLLAKMEADQEKWKAWWEEMAAMWKKVVAKIEPQKD
jgi:hypothetical protein